MSLLFVTGNKGKFDEAKSIISDLEQLDLDLIEIQSVDSKEVITHKLHEAKAKTSGSFVVEDNSLSLEALNGLPGPLIKWFLKKIGNEGLVKIVEDFGNNKAEATVVIGYLSEQGEISFFEGSIQGTIVSPRGDNGFGWDPIFLPDGETKTFGEMVTEEKNKMSMRKIAFQKLKEAISKI